MTSGTREKKGYALKVERGDRPFQYSTEYRDWFAAVRRNDLRAKEEADRAWRARFLRRAPPLREAA